MTKLIERDLSVGVFVGRRRKKASTKRGRFYKGGIHRFAVIAARLSPSGKALHVAGSVCGDGDSFDVTGGLNKAIGRLDSSYERIQIPTEGFNADPEDFYNLLQELELIDVKGRFAHKLRIPREDVSDGAGDGTPKSKLMRNNTRLRRMLESVVEGRVALYNRRYLPEEQEARTREIAITQGERVSPLEYDEIEEADFINPVPVTI